ncbi:MAG: NfeD family protein [Thermoguttaceae bacterium]
MNTISLDLPPLGIEDDPSLEKPWKAVRIDLKGPISGKSVRQAQKLIENQISLCDVNFVCLWIDSPGGSPADSGILADYLLSLDPSRVRTVAYIPKQARADSALIALACDQIIMHPDAVIGGLGPVEISADELALIREMIRDRLAPRKGRSWSLPTALFDGKLDVYRCTRPGEIEYFSPQELAEQPNPGQWEKGAKITTRRAPLKLDGTQAEQMGLIRRVVNNFGELSDYYGLENDPALVEPGWADTLVEALRSPAVAILLFLLGAAGLYFEFHMPGLGIGAFVAVVCFVLFFWSFFLDGASGWLVSMLFLCGVGCLLLEIFVIPGFGIFGLGGGIMLVLSLVLASQLLVIPHGEAQIAEMKRSLLMLGGAAIGLFVLALLARAWLPRGSLLSGMVLAPPAEDESKRISHHELLVDLHNLVGNQGVTTTPLMPGGKARFGDSLVDVIADGEMIERGRQVEVVEVHGNRVLVREIAQA